jgi:hypothetical protein
MKLEDDGGSAFPLHIHGDYGQGMSLRDWLAGKALQGYRSAEPQGSSKTAAFLAYADADAMLAARKERSEP